MKWKGKRESANVDDARGRASGGGGVRGGGGLGLLAIIGKKFGIKGILVPHSFTHGTSEQRMRWFKKGLLSGRIEDGDTFSMAYPDL